jgi:hypothetical protein
VKALVQFSELIIEVLGQLLHHDGGGGGHYRIRPVS